MKHFGILAAMAALIMPAPQEPKHPKRYLVVEDIFCVVLDHIAVFDIFNLFLSLFPATHLKGLAVNLKIRDR